MRAQRRATRSEGASNRTSYSSKQPGSIAEDTSKYIIELTNAAKPRAMRHARHGNGRFTKHARSKMRATGLRNCVRRCPDLFRDQAAHVALSET
jgi:hypothetical protein